MLCVGGRWSLFARLCAMGPRGELWATRFSEKEPEDRDESKGNGRAAAQDTDTASIWFLPVCMGEETTGTMKALRNDEIWIALWCARSWSFTKIRPHVSAPCLQWTIFLPLCFVIVVHHVYTWGRSKTGVMSLNFLPHRLWVDATQFRHFYNYLKEKNPWMCRKEIKMRMRHIASQVLFKNE